MSDREDLNRISALVERAVNHGDRVTGMLVSDANSLLSDAEALLKVREILEQLREGGLEGISKLWIAEQALDYLEKHMARHFPASPRTKE